MQMTPVFKDGKWFPGEYELPETWAVPVSSYTANAPCRLTPVVDVEHRNVVFARREIVREGRTLIEYVERVDAVDKRL